MYNKVTVGFVVQTFSGGKCIRQEFICGDDVTYENTLGERIDVDLTSEPYFPFDMIQPEK